MVFERNGCVATGAARFCDLRRRGTAVELDEQTAGRLDEVARSAGLVREQLNALQDDLIGHAAI